MNTYRLDYEDGNHTVTEFNGTLPEAREYYVGRAFNFGDTDWGVPDKMVRAVRVSPVEPTIYEACVARDIPCHNHESDLYIPVTAETAALVKHYGSSATRFINQVEGGTWYDVAFAYLPWWQARTGKN